MGPDPALNPELVQAQSFTSSFRGYDQAEVRSFLGRVAAEVRSLRDQVEQLDSAWHSAEERAARPPVIDEDTLMSAVGQETASILRTARAAAADMRAKAAEEAERSVAEATAEAERTATEARARHEQESRQAHESAERIVASAQAEGAQLVERARTEGESTRMKAEQDRALTIEGANATRDRILDDLFRRRRVAEVQIEQLRAGRERLMESYAVVRRTLEEAQSELSRADAEARAAADEVGRRLRGHDPSPPTVRPQSGVILDDSPGPGVGADSGASYDAGTGPGDTRSGDPNGPSDAGPSDNDPPAEVIDLAPADATADTEPSGNAVDELFARIRSTGKGGARGHRSSKGSGDAVAEGATATLSRSDEPVSDAAQTVTTILGPGPAADDATADGEDPTVADGDEVLLQAREAALAEVEAGLTRRLKRALQDEQNDLLDRLRGLKEVPTAASLLPALDEHLARYEQAASPLLLQAFAAGGSFVRSLLDVPAATAPTARVDDLAGEAATAIVEPLRRRLDRALESTGGDDQAALVESLGAAYREWKSQRIERISGDALYAAFARGTWEATPAKTSLRWIVDDVDGPCPDCDDDALAGLLPKGEEFPTGQHHPPAHSGCRCLLAPSPA